MEGWSARDGEENGFNLRYFGKKIKALVSVPGFGGFFLGFLGLAHHWAKGSFLSASACLNTVFRCRQMSSVILLSSKADTQEDVIN